MAHFVDSTATGNDLGGFYTNNPYSIFERCLAQNNRGYGFKDDSGEVVKAALLESLSSLKQQTSSSSTLSNRIEVVQEIDALEKQIKEPAPNQGILAKSFERLKDFVKENVAEVTARTVYEFATKGPEIIKVLHDSGILTN